MNPRMIVKEVSMARASVSLCAVGDIAAFFEDPESAFEHVGPILRGADITFAQNERLYDESSSVVPHAGFTELTSAKNAQALKLGGFDVISFASNHSLDLGADAMLKTIDVLKGIGCDVIGAGSDIQEARRPAIIDVKGTKVGFLAYASVIRPGNAAGPKKAGCAPMRAWTLYEQFDYQPGTPPKIRSFPNREDLQDLLEDIKRVRRQVDVLVVSLHWGIHFQHATIAEYQREVAHAAIDAGADIILGHHPHMLKGIEVYNGKAILYSMGNFIFDLPAHEIKERLKNSAEVRDLFKIYGWKVDPKYTLYAFPPESRKSMILRCEIENGRIGLLAIRPVLINEMAQPRPIQREDRKFGGWLAYMKSITKDQGLSTKFTLDGKEIIINT
jgi:hypothetical protein